MSFKQYKRKQIAELREVTEADIIQYNNKGELELHVYDNNYTVVSISQEDIKNGSPKIGDMIARNPNNYYDQWLVAEEYFNDNFENID